MVFDKPIWNSVKFDCRFAMETDFLYAKRRFMLVPGIVMVNNKSLDVSNAGHPCFCNPLYFLDETAGGDLCRTNFLLGVRCHG